MHHCLLKYSLSLMETDINDPPHGRGAKLCFEGCLSLYCLIGTALLVLVPSVPQIYYGVVPNVWGAVFWGPVLYYAVINMIIRFALRGKNYQIALRASFLGFAEAVSILLICFGPFVWKQFGVYMLFISTFHYSEFLAIAWASPASLTIDSFILNHSVAYGIAAFASWIEFLLEVKFFYDFKGFYNLWIMGVILCIYGEIVRKLAIITAGSSFTHVVQFEKKDIHKLVTNGVYAYARHPSYVGWFWWSIGTQLILLNPVCTLIYTIVSWKFFNDRIFMEEYFLLNFHHEEYEKYQKQVPTGLPFIKGYITE